MPASLFDEFQKAISEAQQTPLVPPAPAPPSIPTVQTATASAAAPPSSSGGDDLDSFLAQVNSRIAGVEPQAEEEPPFQSPYDLSENEMRLLALAGDKDLESSKDEVVAGIGRKLKALNEIVEDDNASTAERYAAARSIAKARYAMPAGAAGKFWKEVIENTPILTEISDTKKALSRWSWAKAIQKGKPPAGSMAPLSTYFKQLANLDEMDEQQARAKADQGILGQAYDIAKYIPGYAGSIATSAGAGKLTTEAIKRAGAEAIKRGGLKGLAVKTAAEVAGKATMSLAPPMAGATSKKMLESMTPEMTWEDTPEGQQLLAWKDGDGWLNAFRKALQSQTTELLIEQHAGDAIGKALGPAVEWAKKGSMKAVPHAVRDLATKVKRGYINAWMDRVAGASARDAAQHMMKEGQWQGLIPELMEEELTSWALGLQGLERGPGGEYSPLGQGIAATASSEGLGAAATQAAAMALGMGAFSQAPHAASAAAGAIAGIPEGRKRISLAQEAKERIPRRHEGREAKWRAAAEELQSDEFLEDFVSNRGEDALEVALGDASRRNFQEAGLDGLGKRSDREAVREAVQRRLGLTPERAEAAAKVLRGEELSVEEEALLETEAPLEYAGEMPGESPAAAAAQGAQPKERPPVEEKGPGERTFESMPPGKLVGYVETLPQRPGMMRRGRGTEGFYPVEEVPFPQETPDRRAVYETDMPEGGKGYVVVGADGSMYSMTPAELAAAESRVAPGAALTGEAAKQIPTAFEGGATRRRFRARKKGLREEEAAPSKRTAGEEVYKWPKPPEDTTVLWEEVTENPPPKPPTKPKLGYAKKPGLPAPAAKETPPPALPAPEAPPAAPPKKRASLRAKVQKVMEGERQPGKEAPVSMEEIRQRRQQVRQERQEREERELEESSLPGQRGPVEETPAQEAARRRKMAEAGAEGIEKEPVDPERLRAEAMDELTASSREKDKKTRRAKREAAMDKLALAAELESEKYNSTRAEELNAKAREIDKKARKAAQQKPGMKKKADGGDAAAELHTEAAVLEDEARAAAEENPDYLPPVLSPKSAKRGKNVIGIVYNPKGLDALDQLVKTTKKGLSRLWKRMTRSAGNLPSPIYGRMEKARLWLSSELKELKMSRSQLASAMKEEWGATFSSMTDKQEEALRNLLSGKPPGSPVPPKVKAAVQRMRNHIDALSQRLVNSGAVDFSDSLRMTILKNKGAYVTRAYRIFEEPGEWGVSRIPDHVLNLARTEIGRLYPNAKPETVDAYIKSLLHSKDESPLQAWSRIGTKDLGILRQKHDVPVWLRALWGEYNDPVENYVLSVGRLANLIANHELLNDLATDPAYREWFTPPAIRIDPRTGKRRVLPLREAMHMRDNPLAANPDHTVEIAVPQNHSMAPLNGYMTSPEVKREFEEALAPQVLNKWHRLYMRVVGISKYSATVASMQTHPRNFFANFGFAWMNGHWNVKDLNKSFQITLRDYLSSGEGTRWNKETEVEIGGNKVAFETLIKRLAELGVIDDNVQVSEVMETLRDMKGVDAAAHFDNRLNDINAWSAKGRTLGDKLKDLYQAEDNFWKIYSFLDTYQKYREALPASRATNEQVEEMAAANVRDTFPTYSKIPPGVKMFRRNPLIAPFVSFPAEVYRTSLNWGRLVKSELADPDLKHIGLKRLVSGLTYHGFGLGAGLAASWLLRLPPDDLEDLRFFAPPWMLNTPWIPWSGDGLSRTVIDLGYTDPHAILREPMFALARGVSDGEYARMLGESVSSLTEPFMSWELVTKAVVEAIANKKLGMTPVSMMTEIQQGTGGPVYNKEEGGAFWKGLGHVFRQILPGTVKSFERVGKAAAGYTEETGQSYELGPEFFGMIGGMKPFTIDVERSVYFKAGFFKGRWDDATSIIKSKAKKPGDVSDYDLSKKYEAAEKARLGIFTQLNDLCWRAIRLGMRPDEVKEQLQARGWSEDEAERVITGVYIPYAPSKTDLKTMAKSKGGMTRGLSMLRKFQEQTPVVVAPKTDRAGMAGILSADWKTLEDYGDALEESYEWLGNYPLE